MEKCLQTRVGDSEVEVSAANLLELLPPGVKYLFLDKILEADEKHIVAQYRFREDEFFYPGHFPDWPVTPGTILLEAMCQCGVTAQSYYLLARESGSERAKQFRILFTSSEVEWFSQVRPGDLVIMRSELLAWRACRIRARVKMYDEEGSLLAESVVSGMAVLGRPDGLRETGSPSKNVDFKNEKPMMGEGVQYET